VIGAATAQRNPSARSCSASGPGTPDDHRRGVAAERHAPADGDRGRAVRAPPADDRRLVAVLVADHVRRLRAEQPADLLGHGGEDLTRVALAGDERRDPPQRRLLGREGP
jgi:hypothetical protein